jgi:hypothetical protein
MALICVSIGLVGGFPWKMLLFFMVFSSMQLFEYYIWSHLNDTSLNRFYSKFGYAIITLEPAAALWLISGSQWTTGRNIAIGCYLTIMGFYTILNRIDYRTTVGQNGHLHYHFVPSGFGLYQWLWILAFFTGIGFSGDMFVILISMATCLYSLYQMWWKHEFNSYWCYVANVIWIYVVGWVIWHQMRLTGQKKR